MPYSPEAHLRHVKLDNGYQLRTWDTGGMSHGKYTIGYSLFRGDIVIFEGEDMGCSPLHSIDSDETLRSLLTFLTLQPGDTDPEYFDSYTPEQMDFARTDAEGLSLYALDESGIEFVNLDDWQAE